MCARVLGRFPQRGDSLPARRFLLHLGSGAEQLHAGPTATSLQQRLRGRRGSTDSCGRRPSGSRYRRLLPVCPLVSVPCKQLLLLLPFLKASSYRREQSGAPRERRRPEFPLKTPPLLRSVPATLRRPSQASPRRLHVSADTSYAEESALTIRVAPRPSPS